MKAVIMAGGKGTRLRSIASDIPKPMVSVLGKPILEYQIENLRKNHISDITIIVGHLGEVIQQYFGDGSKWDVAIDYIEEPYELGTAGALFYLKNKKKEDFVLLFGDLMIDIDWKRFIAFHQEKGAMISLFGHPNSHPFDSDIIIRDAIGKVIEIDSKNNLRDYNYRNFVNAGLYCVNYQFLNRINEVRKLDLEKDLVVPAIEDDEVYAYKSTEYVKDMGTPERYYTVEKDLVNGIVASRNLLHKQKCIFLDRDGTINEHIGFLREEKELKLYPGVADAIQMINNTKYLCIVATNQPVIARGECTYEEMSRIHMKMETELGKDGAYVDDIFFCPHHPDKGFDGEVKELKIDCNCRKPKIGMIEKASEVYNIDLTKSWYIGDTTVDVETGINAGMHTILLKTGEGGRDNKYNNSPDVTLDNLKQAINYITKERKE